MLITLLVSGALSAVWRPSTRVMPLSFAQPPSQEETIICPLYELPLQTCLSEISGAACGCQKSDLCNTNICFKIYVILTPVNEVDRSCDQLCTVLCVVTRYEKQVI